MSVILKERKGTDSVTLAWQGPEPSDGTVVEYEVTYYEKVRRFRLFSAYADLHDLLALCESSLHWLDIWLLTFIVPWGRDCNVNTDMLHSVPINIHGSPVCQKPLRLSHFKTWWHYCPEQITEALFRRAAKIQFLLHPTQTCLVF